MLSFDYRHRVRYRECDPMGVVYHTHYLDYFEIARTEALRDLGLPYAELEEAGISMPVTDVSVQYRRSATYDDVLIIRSIFPETVPVARVKIEYVVFREDVPDEVIATGHVSLCFMDTVRGRPTRAPRRLVEIIERELARN